MVEFDDNNINTNQLEDRRSGGGGGGMPSGGMMGAGAGGLGLLGLILMMFLGGGSGGGTDLGSILNQTPQNQTQTQQQGQVSSADLKARCGEPDGLQKYDDCFLLKVMNETSEVWTGVLGSGYVEPKVVFFKGRTNTACGGATSNLGPFYCPGDDRVYFDLDYLNTLQSQLGAQGRYAQAYIAAHEVGHHLQNKLGIEKQVRQAQQRNPKLTNQLGVKMELQADCFAGVFGRLANDKGNIKITRVEFEQAMKAAAAVGDDAIQRGAGQRVNPEAFTHGTSAQRQQWFTTGFESGDYRQCDTFKAA